MMHPLMRTLKKAAYYLPRRFGSFAFGNRKLAYYCHPYNHTWMNERCVEIPLALDYLRPGMRVLEVGRVLDHYRPFPHDCVDKFEPGAVNVDIVDYRPEGKYDLILSISTLEHVGWDEDRNREKIHVAIRHLRSLLKPGGVLVATLPTGYNQNLDEDLKGGTVFFPEQHYFARTTLGRWAETPVLISAPYNFRDGWANAFLLGIARA